MYFKLPKRFLSSYRGEVAFCHKEINKYVRKTGLCYFTVVHIVLCRFIFPVPSLLRLSDLLLSYDEL